MMEKWCFNGRLRVRLISGDISAALSSLEMSNIFIQNVVFEDALTVCFEINRNDLEPLCTICKKRGEEVVVLDHRGALWKVRALLKRPVLVLGLTFILLISLWLQGRVLFFRVEGNETIPDLHIIEQVQISGITLGSSTREIRSEHVKNRMLSLLPQLQWVGVNTKGCVVTVSVREKKYTPQEETPYSVSSIVAARDGVVREITVLRGTGMCKPGDAVKAGDLLISGYTDCGLCLRAENAQGEVYGETVHPVTVFYPGEYMEKVQSGSEKKNISIILGKKRINLHNSSGIPGDRCVRIYSEQYMTLPGGFYLPIALCVERIISFETSTAMPQENGDAVLSFAKHYLQSQMIAGKILSEAYTTGYYNGFYRLDAMFDCYEIIGVLSPEERIFDHENH